MADSYKAEVDLALKAPDAKNLEKTLTQILDMVDKLPGKGKSASSAVNEIVDQIKKIKKAIDDTGSLNAVIGDVKTLGASMKSLNTLSKGMELFSNQDIQRINSATASIQQAAKAYEAIQRNSQIQKGTFGLDETKVAGVVRAAKTLKTELNAIQQSLSALNGEGKPRVNLNDPLVQKGLQIQKNLKNLEDYRLQLQRNADAEKAAELARRIQAKQTAEQLRAEEKQKNQFFAQGDGRVQAKNITEGFARSDVGQKAIVNKTSFSNAGTARYADDGFIALQNARRELADVAAANRLRLDGLNLRSADARLSEESRKIQQQITQRVKENTAELAKGNGETQKSKQLSQEILDLQAKLKLQKAGEAQNNPLLKQASEQNRIDAMLSRTTGAGGAALLRVQLALMANYSVLNTAIGSVQAAISTSIQLEAAFRNIQAVTATTSTEMAGLETKIKSVAATSKFSAVEVADAALILGQAGLSARQVADALPSVVVLATAAGTSLANAVDLVTSIVGVFDKQASDTADVANKITAASNSSKVSVDKLALAFQYVGNAAAQTGVSFEETTAALAAMSNAGIKSGSTLGTGLRQFLTEVQKPSEEFLSTLRRVGLTLSDIDIRSNGLVGVIQNLRSAGFVASDAIRSFDVRGAAAFNALVANPEAFRQQYEALQNTRAAVEANEIQMQSLDAQSKRLTTSITNAVSVGFGPLQKILTMVASGLADVIQGTTEYKGVLEAVTTAGVLFVSVGLTRYLAGIAVGFFTTAGVTTGLGTALTGLMAATLGSTTSMLTLTGATGTATASLAAMGMTIRAVGVSMLTMSGAVSVISGAFRALLAGLAGLSVLTGIGIALAAVATALIFWESAADKAKKKTDELKASSSEAKAAFEDKQKSTELLSKKIDELTYKESTLTGNSAGLRQAALDLNAQFGSLGLQIDVNNNSFAIMIEKLKGVRSEMRALADAKLTTQIQKDRELLEQETKNLQQQLGTNNRNAGGTVTEAGRRLQGFVESNKLYQSSSLSNSQKGEIKTAIDVFKSASGPAFLSNPESVSALLRSANALDAIRNSLTTEKQKEAFDAVTKPLSLAVNKAIDVANQRGVVDGGLAAQNLRANDAKFQGLTAFGGKTYSEALPNFYDVQRKVITDSRAAGTETNEVQAYFQIKQRIEQEIGKTEAVKRVLDDLKRDSIIDPDTYELRLTEANQRAEQFRAAGTTLYRAVESRLKADTEGQVQELNAMAGNRNLPLAKRRNAATEAARLKGELLLAGAFGSNERAEALAAQQTRVGAAKADALRQSGSGNKAQDAAKEAAARFIAEAELYETQAKGATINAKNSTTLVEMSDFLDEAMSLMAKAKVARLKALTQTQNARNSPENQDPKVIAAEVAAETDTLDEKLNNFISGTIPNVLKSVQKRITKLGSKWDAEVKAQELKEIQSRGEQSLFDAGLPLLEIQKQLAQETLPPGTIEQKKAEAALARQKLMNLGEELAFFSEYVIALSGAARLAKEELEEAEARAKSNPTEVNKLLLESARSNSKEVNDRLNSATKDRNQARGNYGNQQAEVYARDRAVPMEANWENLSSEMERVASNYRKSVEQFDEVGHYAKGMEDVLGGLSGNFAALFSNILSGSMSAKEAFRTFAQSIIKSMLDIISQALAMAAIKQILNMMGLGLGFAGAAPASSGPTPTFDNPSIPMAGGGPITGGVQGRDSVPVLAMPGEYVVKKSAVDAVGVDFMNGLNSQTTKSVAAASQGMGSSSGTKTPEVTNIWVVTPDQMEPLGAKDVKIIIADSLNQQNSPIKTLVRQIAAGG